MAKTMTPPQAEVAQGTWFQARLPQIVLLVAASGFGVTFVELMLIGLRRLRSWPWGFAASAC